MKKIISGILVITVLLALCISVSSCNKEKTIVGTWEHGEDGFSYTFNKDGSGYFKLGEQKNNFTYTVHSNELSILYEHNTMTYNYTFVLGDDDTFVLTDEKGLTTTYSKK